MWRRLVNSLVPRAWRKEHVGTDSLGNQYYRWKEQGRDGEEVEKRCVQYVDGEYDPKTVPPEWWSWLSMSRREPPTEELMEQIERMRESTKAKAAALKIEELKRRAERNSTHPHGDEQGMEQGLDSLLQDLGHKGKIGPGDNGEEEEQDLAWKPEAWKP